MGIQINGNTDNISAVDGGLTISDLEINQSGISTFNNTVKVGTGVTALTNGNVSIGGTFEIFESSGIANRNFSQFKLSNFSISQHQNTGSYFIKNSSTGQLIIGGGSGGNGGVALYNNNLGAKYLRTHSQGSVEIFHDNTVRFETSGIGATVYGQLDTTNLDVAGVTTFTGHIEALSDVYIPDKIIHAGDANTQIRFPAADTISMETSGSERLSIESGGDIDIKSGVLKLASGANRRLMYRSGNNDVILEADSGDFYRQDIANSTHEFFTGNVERVRITSGGVVNIGANNLSQTTYKAQIETGTNKFISFTNAAHDDFSNEASAIIFSRVSDGAKELSGIFQHSTTSFGIATRSDLTLHAGGNGTYSGAPERLRITSSGDIIASSTVGHVLLGLGASRTINSHAPRLQITGTSYSHSTVSIINNEANGNGAYLFLGKQRSGAVGGNTAVQANDIIGELRFPAGDGTDMENYVARIQAKAQLNASSNNTSGYLDFYTTRQTGSSHLKLRIGQNSSHGTQFSFGTETSDLNNTNTGDRTSLKVGPATHIEGVFGHNGTSGMYYNCYSGGNDLFYRGTRAPSNADWRPAAYGQKYGSHYFYGDPSNTAYSAQAQVTTMQTNMTISREGYVKKQYQPAFDAVRTAGTLGDSAYQKIVFNNAMTNVGNHYNTSNGYFTAPIAGTYFFSFFGMNNNNVAWYNFRKNNSIISPQHGAYMTNGSDWAHVSMTIVIVLAANDTMAVYTGNSPSVGMYGQGNNHNGFCGYMLG